MRKGELRDEINTVAVHLCLHIHKHLCKILTKKKDFRDILNWCVCVNVNLVIQVILIARVYVLVHVEMRMCPFLEVYFNEYMSESVMVTIV